MASALGAIPCIGFRGRAAVRACFKVRPANALMFRFSRRSLCLSRGASDTKSEWQSRKLDAGPCMPIQMPLPNLREQQNQRQPERISGLKFASSFKGSSVGRWNDNKKRGIQRIRSSVSEPQNAEGMVELSPADLKLKETLKLQLEERLEGINMGIFGIRDRLRIEILALLRDLEDLNPVPEPLDHMEYVSGNWKLLFTTVKILGSKRSKLGLRSFVSLGNFTQKIDPDKRLATNRIEFSVAGFDSIMGNLTVEATYTPTSPTQVDIKYKRSKLVPEKLQKLFEANYALLLSIFNPEGWLEITFVDDTHRIGRNDKGQIFYLVRNEDPTA